MARKNIFEILNGSELDLEYEVRKLFSLLQEECIDYLGSYTVEAFVDEYEFAKWPHRCRCRDTDEMKLRLNIRNLKQILSSNFNTLNYLEYIGNMLFLCQNTDEFLDYDDDFNYITESLRYILDQLNMSFYTHPSNDRVTLQEKDPAATAAAEISEPQLALSIIEYNHHTLKGDLEAKKSILFSLGHDLERYSRELKTFRPDLADEAGFLLNSLNIRHNNSTPPEGKSLDNYIPHVAEMKPETLEEWYDETYQVLLLCILEYDHLARKGKIKELKDACYASKALAKKQ